MAAGTVDVGVVDLIGRIYDCVIDPGRWYDTLDRLRQRFELPNITMSVLHLAPARGLYHVVVNVPDEFQALAQDPTNAIIDLWGGEARLAGLPVEEPILNSNVVGRASLEANSYYQAFAVPQGLNDQIAMILARDSTSIANISLGIHETSPGPDETVFEELRILAPHFRRAVVIGRILDVASTTASNFEAALNASAAGVVLVDASMRVLHANAAAAVMLEAGDPIQMADGRLALSHELVPGQIEKAVQESADDEGRIGRHGIGVPARRRSGAALTLNVMPLERRQLRLAGHAVAAIFIGDQSSGVQPSRDLLSVMFDLTPAEARVFELTVAGQRSAEVAKTLGITVSTMRTHLSRVLAKTGRHSRVELMRLADEIRLPG